MSHQEQQVQQICKEKDCEHPVQARGMCKKHYQKWYLEKNPNLQKCKINFLLPKDQQRLLLEMSGEKKISRATRKILDFLCDWREEIGSATGALQKITEIIKYFKTWEYVLNESGQINTLEEVNQLVRSHLAQKHTKSKDDEDEVQ